MEKIAVMTEPQIREFVLDVIREVQRSSTKFEIEPEQKYYTRSEIAHTFRLSLPTVDKYASQGLLKKKQIGSRILFSVDEATDALQCMEVVKYKRR